MQSMLAPEWHLVNLTDHMLPEAATGPVFSGPVAGQNVPPGTGPRVSALCVHIRPCWHSPKGSSLTLGNGLGRELKNLVKGPLSLGYLSVAARVATGSTGDRAG